MSIFNTIVPTFGRSPASRENDGGSAHSAAPTLKPFYEVKETDDAYGLTVYLPGVSKEGLEITAAEGELTIAGRRGWKRPEGWTQLYRESSDASYQLVLTHDNALDLDKIHAELTDGLLRVALPKTEAIKPRKIAVG